jgi:hypothetical protein
MARIVYVNGRYRQRHEGAGGGRIAIAEWGYQIDDGVDEGAPAAGCCRWSQSTGTRSATTGRDRSCAA